MYFYIKLVFVALIRIACSSRLVTLIMRSSLITKIFKKGSGKTRKFVCASEFKGISNLGEFRLSSDRLYTLMSCCEVSGSCNRWSTKFLLTATYFKPM